MVISHDYHSISFHIWLPYNWGHNCTYHYLSRGHNRSGMSQSHPWREQFRLFIMNEMIWWPEAKLVDLICLPTFCPNILKSYHIKSTTPMQLDCSCVDDMGLSENGVPHYHGLSLIMIIWSYDHMIIFSSFKCHFWFRMFWSRNYPSNGGFQPPAPLKPHTSWDPFQTMTRRRANVV